MKAPFPWFGGKRRVAHLVWPVLGDVSHFVEPFAGSLAILLARPPWHRGHSEVVNDLDAYLSNFWRAIQRDPEAVAEHADWPVNEVDLLARHRWLVSTGRERIEDLEQDPEHFDPKVAGWWVWGLSCWIGGGWCERREAAKKASVLDAGKKPHLGHSMGVHQQVGRKRPNVTTAGAGVHRRQIPTISQMGQRGVNQPAVWRARPHLGNGGHGVQAQRRGLLAWFAELAGRLRHVRVCCGDWARVVTDGALAHGKTVGVFLDPPYDTALRSGRCYAQESVEGLSDRVRAWALEKGKDPRMRIVLCGYEPEHGPHMPDSWRMVAWSGSGAYKTRATKDTCRAETNRHLERLWFSPNCLEPKQQELFAMP